MTFDFLCNNVEWSDLPLRLKTPPVRLSSRMVKFVELRWVYQDSLVRQVKLDQLESEMDHQLYEGKKEEFNVAFKLHDALCEIDADPPTFPEGSHLPAYKKEEKFAHAT